MQLIDVIFIHKVGDNMNQVKMFRENTRRLEMNLGNVNNSDCCCCGISNTQCFVLVEIGRKANISVKELSEILRLDKSGISRMVEELVQKGFVDRVSSKEDRRYVVLNLTDTGIERFNKIENDMNQKFKNILERIPRDKRNQVIEALQLYNTALEMCE